MQQKIFYHSVAMFVFTLGSWSCAYASTYMHTYIYIYIYIYMYMYMIVHVHVYVRKMPFSMHVLTVMPHHSDAQVTQHGFTGLHYSYVAEFDCNRRMMFVSASEEKRGMTFVYSTQDASVTTANLNLLQLDSPPWRPTQLAHSYVCVSVDSAFLRNLYLV